MPECVKVATQTYQQESDPLASFIAEKCIEDPAGIVQAATFYRAYKGWAGDTDGDRLRTADGR